LALKHAGAVHWVLPIWLALDVLFGIAVGKHTIEEAPISLMLLLAWFLAGVAAWRNGLIADIHEEDAVAWRKISRNRQQAIDYYVALTDSLTEEIAELRCPETERNTTIPPCGGPARGDETGCDDIDCPCKEEEK
jgi:uncharacterized membrane protein